MPESLTPSLTSSPTDGEPWLGVRYGGRDAWIASGFLTGYLILDWISYAEPFLREGMTPWEPAAGLAVALVLLTGLRYALLLLLAPILSEFFVRGLSMPVGALLLTTLVIGGVYTGAGLVLRWWMRRDEGPLTTLRNVLLLFIVALVASFLLGIGETGVLMSSRMVPSADLVSTVVKELVGEFIGIALTVPFVVMLARRRLNFSWSMLVPLATIAALMTLIFSLPQAAPLQLFHVLFVPIIWMAVVYGLEGAAVAAVATQFGLIATLNMIQVSPTTVLSFQVLMIVLSVTGMLTGAAVSDRERAAVRFRKLQDAQARFNRLSSMGALSAVLAHEIRQPLGAAATYARLAREALPPDGPDSGPTREHLEKSSAQIQRAAGILRRMHDLIVTGRSEPVPTAPATLVDEAVSFLEATLTDEAVVLVRRIAPALPKVRADVQQLHQVIINLVVNSIEAMVGLGRDQRVITIAVTREAPGFVTFRVSDRGHGFSEEQLESQVTPLLTEKVQGLGLGLALCETIVQNHGGALRLANSPVGAMVEFTLPEVSKDER